MNTWLILWIFKIHLILLFIYIYVISPFEIFYLSTAHFANVISRSMLGLPLETTNKYNIPKRGYAEAAAISNFSHIHVKGEKEKWLSEF